jgi:hypothetical protein
MMTWCVEGVWRNKFIARCRRKGDYDITLSSYCLQMVVDDVAEEVGGAGHQTEVQIEEACRVVGVGGLGPAEWFGWIPVM